MSKSTKYHNFHLLNILLLEKVSKFLLMPTEIISLVVQSKLQFIQLLKLRIQTCKQSIA